MNNLDAIKQSQSATFKKKNPHIFGGGPLLGDGGEDDAEHDLIEALTTKQKPKKRIRQSSAPTMNALETEFYGKLIKRFNAFMVYSQAVRLKIGNGVTLTPDFFLLQADDGAIAYEVKGPYAREDSLVKLKCAATTYPTIKFILAWKDKETGQWQEQHVLP